MRLQQKALLVTLPLILVPILILGLLSFYSTKEAQIQIENAKLQADVTFRANAIVNYVENARSALKYLTNNNDIRLLQNQLSRDLPYTLAQEFIQESFEFFAHAYPDSHSILIFDGERKLLFGYSQGEYDTTDLELVDGSENQYWRLRMVAGTDWPQVEIQLPLATRFEDINPNTKPWGYIQLVLQPNWQELLELSLPDQGSHLPSFNFMITDLTGRLLFSFPKPEIGNQLPRRLFERLLASAESQQATDVTDGGQKLYLSGKVLQAQYLLLIGLDESHVLQKGANITWLTGLVVLLSVVIAPGLLFYSFSRMVIQPIEKLANAKQQVAQGQLDVKLDIPSKDELGELFAAFNVMVRQLVVYRENERESRLRLEYKVKERTEELEETNAELENTNTALAKAKQLSEEANRLKSAFVANISHEIRTPLTAILGFTEQVIADMPSSRYQLDLLGRVLNSGNHLLALINDILDLSKIESNKLDLELNKVDIFELFNDVISILSSQAASKNLEFEFNQHYPLPRFIRSDETRLRQILLNLASNAIKFTEQGFIHIHVCYLVDTSKVEVRVKDSGIGMSKEVQTRIFSPFVQADVSISRKFGGTGLGLVISKSLANLLGGDIRVESEEGNGSEFILEFATSVDGETVESPMIHSMLDLAIDDKKRSAKAQVQSKPERRRNLNLSGRVLIAEDVEDNQYLFKLLLRTFKVDYEMVENGQMAVERALAQDYDLILMDMQMPVMGGLEATTLLRQAGVDTPIYALTANIMREDVDKHLEAGCNGTIAKPIEKKEFYRVLERHLSSDEEQVESPLIPEAQMAELRARYLVQLAAQNDRVDVLVQRQDLPALREECHKIKGSAGSYGFDDLTKLAGETEAWCKSLLALEEQDWSQIETEIAPLRRAIDDIIQQDKSGDKGQDEA